MHVVRYFRLKNSLKSIVNGFMNGWTVETCQMLVCVLEWKVRSLVPRLRLAAIWFIEL